MVTCWVPDTDQPVVTEVHRNAINTNCNQFDQSAVSTADGWGTYWDQETQGLLCYRELESGGNSYRVEFQDNSGGSFTASTTIGFSILKCSVTTPAVNRTISISRVALVK